MSSRQIDRRKFIVALGAGSSTALAGCSVGSNDQDDQQDQDDQDDQGGQENQSQEVGERVPTISMYYWTNLGSTTAFWENSLPIVQDNWQEIGIELETQPVGISPAIEEISNDTREYHVATWSYIPTPERADPNTLMSRFNIMNAGANGRDNALNYASCDYSTLVQEQAKTPQVDERQDLVAEAYSVMSEDRAPVPVVEAIRYGAINTDQLEATGLGQAGLVHANPVPMLNVSGDKVINVYPYNVENPIHLTYSGRAGQSMFNNIIYSPLLQYDENFEVQQNLASDWEIGDDGLTYTFEIHDDATFHNGDPVTAEDVKFTYRFAHENDTQWPLINAPPYDGEPEEAIEVVDDKTVQITLSEQLAPFHTTHVTALGILPKEHWEDLGAWENPTSFDLDPIVGSGPYQVTNFTSGQSMALEPFEDHPVQSPSGSMTWVGYEDVSTAYRAFEQGDVNVLVDLVPGLAEEIRNEHGDWAEPIITNAWVGFNIFPQYSFAPGKFGHFREAISWALDRNLINETAMYGDSSPMTRACIINERSEWYPGDENLNQISNDDGTPAPDRAREILSDEGYSWDDNDRLRYPQDIDLEPRWPQGDEPADHPDQFPCVTELGE